MSNVIDNSGKNIPELSVPSTNSSLPKPKSNVPDYETLKGQLTEASALVDDIILKNYLSRLTEFEVVPLDDSFKQIGDFRLFKINQMVYQKDEYSTYKFASVFNSLQNYNCGIFIIADSDGEKTDFYFGVRALNDKRTTKSLKETLRNALIGQFPGVKTDDLLDPEAKAFLDTIQSKSIAVVSCVAKNKDDEFNDNNRFIQGLEKLAITMQGQRYTAVVIAKSTSNEQLADIRHAYETIYTKLSPFANMQLSYGTNTALNISDAFSSGSTKGTARSTSRSKQEGTSVSKGITDNYTESKTDTNAMMTKAVGGALLGVAAVATAPLTGGVSIAAGIGLAVANLGLIAINPKTVTKGTSTSETTTLSTSETFGESESTNESVSENYTKTYGVSLGSSDNIQLTMQNKTIINTLERIDLQLKRIDECESIGMWECAAYFLSDTQEAAEMAAGTYKALMKGENSGVENSAINYWGRHDKNQLRLLREYVTNFLHPVFEYRSDSVKVPITASSLVSGNELAIQMGLPRKSVCGFPVIEHAEFGKEVVKYNQSDNSKNFILGKVFSMGSELDTDVRLDRDSLTMHTFITGSTGSGKSNAVYEILSQLRNLYNIKFLVIEPAKGEYKNIFGQYSDVSVYGTNPKISNLLRINPFHFPSGIHVLEHLDRLVELFNVCWPMYAAMPAILKESMEKAYKSVGWNTDISENYKGEVFPNFADLLEQIDTVISASKYSADSKNDYIGALITRVRSLTNGLNGQIFTRDGLAGDILFENNVIVDLSRVGSTETKSLIMGLLVMKLNEYRMTSGKSNSPLSHITVIEEAHNLLKRTSTEQSSESSNLLGKSVELLANSIAEMRTYGEGFIIADQSPGLLDVSVIRNTNTKIILRLPEQSDRELVGFASSLNEDQIAELSKLERGVAAVYQNDWIEPILVKISKCGIEEIIYIKPEIRIFDSDKILQQLICLLIQGRVREKLDFNIDEIEKNLPLLELSSRQLEFVQELIGDFREDGRLSLWNDKNFKKLSRELTDILKVRDRVEKAVLSSVDIDETTNKLSEIVKSFVPNASEEFTFILNQCFFKDFSLASVDTEKRVHFYLDWVDSYRKRTVLP
jgi:hypothetical protein